MAKMIDADRLLRELTALSHGQVWPGWTYDGIRLLIERQPTLTQPNEWVSVEERLPEPGGLIVYANKYGNIALYGVLRVAKNDRPNRYDYWAYLPELPYCRPPEGEEETL